MHRATLLLFSLVVLVLALSTSHVALSAGLDRDVEGLLPPRLQQQDSPSDPYVLLFCVCSTFFSII